MPYYFLLCEPLSDVRGKKKEKKKKRQSRGEKAHNLVTVVVKELRIPVQEAFDWIGRYHDGLVDQFLSIYGNKIPVFEDDKVNAELKEYLDGVGNWVRANDCWSFEVCIFFYFYFLGRGAATLFLDDVFSFFFFFF